MTQPSTLRGVGVAETGTPEPAPGNAPREVITIAFDDLGCVLVTVKNSAGSIGTGTVTASMPVGRLIREALLEFRKLAAA